MKRGTKDLFPDSMSGSLLCIVLIPIVLILTLFVVVWLDELRLI